MNINELREAFKSASGFLFWENSEIDKAINNGLKFLDSKLYVPIKDQRIFISLPTGEHAVTFPMRCKVIKEVWISSEEGRVRLKKTNTWPEILEETGAKPTTYFPFTTETYEKTGENMEVMGKYADIAFVTGTLRGIAFDTFSDNTYYLEVIGRFESNVLNDVIVENWWSVNFPETLVTAALYVTDINRRNTSGGVELLNSILDTVKEINNDAIEEEDSDTELILEG